MKNVALALALALLGASSAARAVDWEPVPGLLGVSYDAASIRSDSEYAIVWIKDSHGVLLHLEVDCAHRMIGSLSGNTLTYNTEILPGSFEESLMVLCRSKWQFWK